MTERELAAVMRGIAPVVREQIASAVAEARVALTLSYEQVLSPLRERLVVVETRAAAADIAPADMAASVAGLLRQELADLELPATTTSKRTVRDHTGAVKYEIEETR